MLERIIDIRNEPPVDTPQEDLRAASGLVRKDLDDRLIAFITCVNDETQYAICRRYLESLEVPAGFRTERWVVLEARSMAEGYQRAMERSDARYKVYLHQDVYLINPRLLEELLRLFRMYPQLGLVGVVGCTKLPANGIWFVNNPFHSYGCVWEFRKPGGPSVLLGPYNRKRLHFMRFRSFVGDYLRAAAVDGLFMATQYDVAWITPLGGFDLYDQVQCLNFIQAGFEVGIVRQERIWCLHWGPLEELTPEQSQKRHARLQEKAALFRELYRPYLGLSGERLYRKHQPQQPIRLGLARRHVATRDNRAEREAEECSQPLVGGGPAVGVTRTAGRIERLGVVIVTFNGRDVLLRALGALSKELDALDGLAAEIAVVDNASADGTVDAVRRLFPSVRVLRNTHNSGPAAGFNAGLRLLDDLDYVLVMNNDVELMPGSLACMVNYLRRYPQIAGVAAALFNPNGTPQFQRLNTLELIPRKPRRPARVTFVGTTCALVRWSVLIDVGLYDERFYFFNEDLDWSLRAKRRGYVFHFLPEARAIHYGSVGMRQNRTAIFSDLFAANLLYYYKHAGLRWIWLGYWGLRMQLAWLGWKARRRPEQFPYLEAARQRLDSLYRQLREGTSKPKLPQWVTSPAAEKISQPAGKSQQEWFSDGGITG